MLSALAPAKLERVRFPLGELTKPEVRRIARAAGLAVADKRESQDLCFMSGTTRARFLARHGSARDRTGDIVDRHGRVVGRHRGHRHFTVGQRRGLGVAAGEPLYVLAKDARRNRIIVGAREDLAVTRVKLRGCRLYRDGERIDQVRLRYRSRPVACSLEGAPARGHHATLTVELGEPVHGVAPGQTACLLGGDTVFGSGTIA
jgi:tRNA-uridine 2-sulfurtransferase